MGNNKSNLNTLVSVNEIGYEVADLMNESRLSVGDRAIDISIRLGKAVKSHIKNQDDLEAFIAGLQSKE